MTAVSSKRNSTMPGQTAEGRRTFSGANVNTNQKVNNSSTGQKIKNFFRINSKTDISQSGSETGSQKDGYQQQQDGNRTPQSQHNKSSLRSTRFLPHIGRSRSTTVVSEGNQLDEGMSPTAHANPYFQHQGPPALRHHNDNSVPPSPPDTPQTSKKITGDGSAQDAAVSAGKEELARKLRRVASAPNAQGLLFSKKKSGSGDSRPTTAETDTVVKLNGGMGAHSNASALSMMETVPQDDNLLPVPGINGAMSPGKLRNSIAFRRTYSSNSIKVRNVEVGPGSFDKIKLIGKGDVGKVYLVREKKSTRLYAMKGRSRSWANTSVLANANTSQCCRRRR